MFMGTHPCRFPMITSMKTSPGTKKAKGAGRAGSFSFHTTAARSALMSRVRQQGTAAEAVVRGILTDLGFRYRLNVRGLPGSPDVANRSKKKAIFVHGCFWHWHRGCPRGRIPASNKSLWVDKLQTNRMRDERKAKALEDLGFAVLIVWECELGDPAALSQRLRAFWASPGA